MRRRLRPAQLALLTLLLAAPAAAAAGAGTRGAARPSPAPPQEETALPVMDTTADSLRVYLMTVGQGSFIWEKFGHNAIWLYDPVTGLDVAYNWGMFGYHPGYVMEFVQGRLMYWMAGLRGSAQLNEYARDNRTIWLQELNLTREQKKRLREFLEWNARDENRFYRYDYYRDNCSTRVRDALDNVLDGALRKALVGKETGTTYRTHTERLTADAVPAYTGLHVALGPYVDQPIDAWEEGFLPVQLMRHVREIQVPGPDGELIPLVKSEQQVFEATRPAERTAPPSRMIWFALAGLLWAAAIFGAAVLARRGVAGRLIFTLLSAVWALLAGTVGTLITGLWAFTDHAVAYNNENVLQLNPLSLLLFVLLFALAFGRAKRLTSRVAFLLAALSIAGFVLQALPGLDQSNGMLLAASLPLHLGVAFGVRMVRPAGVPAES